MSGQGAFGRVPGNIGLPNPSADLAAVYPHLAQTNAAASDSILAGLEGHLSPGTINALQDANAAFGINSGVPGSGFVNNRLGRNIGVTAEQLQNQALANYSHIVPTVSQTQTVSPQLQTEVASSNAAYNAAPDPTAAQSHAASLYNSYLAMMRGPGGGSGALARSGGGGVVGTRSGVPDGSYGPEIVAPSTSTATMYGGVPYYNNQTPGSGPLAVTDPTQIMLDQGVSGGGGGGGTSLDYGMGPYDPVEFYGG